MTDRCTSMRELFNTIALLAVSLFLFGCTPRYYEHDRALRSGDMPTIRRLFATRADTEVRIQTGSKSDFWAPPLHVALSTCNVDAVKHLLTIGASPNAEDFQRQSAFFVVSSFENDAKLEEIVGLLCDAGGDIDKPEGRHSLTPLMYSSLTGHPRTVAVLISHGARVDIEDPKGDTALSIARREYDMMRHENRAEVIQILESAERKMKQEIP